MKKRAFLCIFLIICMLTAVGCVNGNESASGGGNASDGGNSGSGNGNGGYESASIGSIESFDWGEKQEFTEHRAADPTRTNR